jgi:hypothetical protein
MQLILAELEDLKLSTKCWHLFLQWLKAIDLLLHVENALSTHSPVELTFDVKDIGDGVDPCHLLHCKDLPNCVWILDLLFPSGHLFLP